MTPQEAIEYNKNLKEYMKIVDTKSEYNFLPENYEALEIAIKALEQTRWIPVSERLPEEVGEYLVTTKWKGSYSGDVYIETNIDVYCEKPKEWDNNDVIAWMPLPEPYRVEREEQ